MTTLLRVFLLLVVLMAARGFWRAWRLAAARAREHRREAVTDRFGKRSDQEVSDADFEEIP